MHEVKSPIIPGIPDTSLTKKYGTISSAVLISPNRIGSQFEYTAKIETPVRMMRMNVISLKTAFQVIALLCCIYSYLFHSMLSISLNLILHDSMLQGWKAGVALNIWLMSAKKTNDGNSIAHHKVECVVSLERINVPAI